MRIEEWNNLTKEIQRIGARVWRNQRIDEMDLTELGPYHKYFRDVEYAVELLDMVADKIITAGKFATEVLLTADKIPEDVLCV